MGGACTHLNPHFIARPRTRSACTPTNQTRDVGALHTRVMLDVARLEQAGSHRATPEDLAAWPRAYVLTSRDAHGAVCGAVRWCDSRACDLPESGVVLTSLVARANTSPRGNTYVSASRILARFHRCTKRDVYVVVWPDSDPCLSRWYGVRGYTPTDIRATDPQCVVMKRAVARPRIVEDEVHRL
jgi:hypothetical protein